MDNEEFQPLPTNERKEEPKREPERQIVTVKARPINPKLVQWFKDWSPMLILALFGLIIALWPQKKEKKETIKTESKSEKPIHFHVHTGGKKKEKAVESKPQEEESKPEKKIEPEKTVEEDEKEDEKEDDSKNENQSSKE